MSKIQETYTKSKSVRPAAPGDTLWEASLGEATATVTVGDLPEHPSSGVRDCPGVTLCCRLELPGSDSHRLRPDYQDENAEVAGERMGWNWGMHSFEGRSHRYKRVSATARMVVHALAELQNAAREALQAAEAVRAAHAASREAWDKCQREALAMWPVHKD